MNIKSVIVNNMKSNMKKCVVMILVAFLLPLFICAGNKKEVYAKCSVAEMGVEGGESDSGNSSESGDSSNSGSASTSGYSEEQIAAAKAWLSAHGYSPTRAGAAAAYQDYLNGKFDDDPDVKKYKGQSGSSDTTTGSDTTTEKSTSDVDVSAEKTSTGSDTSGTEVSMDDLPNLFMNGGDTSSDAQSNEPVDVQSTEGAGDGLKINDNLKLSERDDSSVYVFYDYCEPEQVVRESSFVIYIIFSVVIVMVIVSLVMLIKTKKKNGNPENPED